jgi:hypothetical protein
MSVTAPLIRFVLSARCVVALAAAALSAWFLAWAIPLPIILQRLGMAVGYALVFASIILYCASWWRAGRPTWWSR